MFSAATHPVPPADDAGEIRRLADQVREVNRDHRRPWWLAMALCVTAALGSLVALVAQAVFSTGVDLGADTTATHLRLLVFTSAMVAVLVGIGYALAGQIDRQFRVIRAVRDDCDRYIEAFEKLFGNLVQLHAEVQDATTAMTTGGFAERFNILVQEAGQTRAFLRRKEDAIEELFRRHDTLSLLIAKWMHKEERPATSAEVAAIAGTLEKDHALIAKLVAELTKSVADRQEAAFVDGYARGVTEKANGHGPHLHSVDP